VAYSRQQIIREVPVDLAWTRVRAELIPVALGIGASTHVVGVLAVSGGSLRAEAEVEVRAPGRRALWVVGLGPRIRHDFGLFFAEFSVEGTSTLTRRTFDVTGLEAPLFTLPRFGAAASLAVGVPLGP
jgi:hypothetical protein